MQPASAGNHRRRRGQAGPVREVSRFGLYDMPRSLSYRSIGGKATSLFRSGYAVTGSESQGCLVVSPEHNGRRY